MLMSLINFRYYIQKDGYDILFSKQLNKNPNIILNKLEHSYTFSN